jgi:hypothetical protein
MNIDDFKIYLPKFLSAESDRDLFKGLKDFPENMDDRLYTSYLKDSKLIYQGDGINDLLVVNLPQSEIKPAPGIIFSNTCDLDLENQRNFPSQIVYAPIFNLEKYQLSLINKSKKTKEQIIDHISAIKKQEITQIFYLPKLDGKLDDSIVFLDRVNNMPNKLVDRDNVPLKRIFTLSDYGAYLFILKLSIHFTRIQDKVERKSIIE